MWALAPDRQIIRIVSFMLESFFKLFGISFIGMFMEFFTWDSWNSCGVRTSKRNWFFEEIAGALLSDCEL